MRITLSLPQELVKEAKIFAIETGRSLSGLVRISLERMLKEVFDHSNENSKSAG